MKRKWTHPTLTPIPFKRETLGDAAQLSNTRLKILLEDGGFSFNKKFHAKDCYIYRRIADSDVLISVNQNIANFNGYIELNASAAFLWKSLQTPCTSRELEQALSHRFQLPREQAVQDVLGFLEELQKQHMITVSQEEGRGE